MRKLLFSVLTLFIFAFVVPSAALAAGSLSLTPASGTFANGSTVKVNVYANTGGEASNAVQANIAYPTDKLQFQSISTSGSALTIFAEKSASGGIVRIAGGTPSPGFNGNKLIATVSFKAISDTGSAQLSFAGDSAILRDSDNANTLSGKGTATFTLGKGSTTTTTTGTTVTPAAGAPKPATTTTSGINITNVAVDAVSTTSATISWKTDISSNSSVEYGTDTEYGFVQSSDESVLDHKIVLNELLVPGTTYHFRVKSSAGDKEGQGEDMTFKTKGYSVVIRVVDGAGKGIAGAAVTIYSDIQQGTTDSKGEVTFMDVSAGTHGVIVKNNNQTVIDEVEVKDGGTMTFDVTFSEKPLSAFAPWMLYGFVGFIVVLTIVLLVVYILKNKNANSDTPTV